MDTSEDFSKFSEILFISEDVICATCLARDRNLYHLENPLRRLMIGLGIMISSRQKVCWECVAMIKKMDRFRHNSLRAQLILFTKNTKALNAIGKMSRLTKTKPFQRISITCVKLKRRKISDDLLTSVSISEKQRASQTQLSLEPECMSVNENGSGKWVVEPSISLEPNSTIAKKNGSGKWVVQPLISIKPDNTTAEQNESANLVIKSSVSEYTNKKEVKQKKSGNWIIEPLISVKPDDTTAEQNESAKLVIKPPMSVPYITEEEKIKSGYWIIEPLISVICDDTSAEQNESAKVVIKPSMSVSYRKGKKQNESENWIIEPLISVGNSIPEQNESSNLVMKPSLFENPDGTYGTGVKQNENRNRVESLTSVKPKNTTVKQKENTELVKDYITPVELDFTTMKQNRRGKWELQPLISSETNNTTGKQIENSNLVIKPAVSDDPDIADVKQSESEKLVIQPSISFELSNRVVKGKECEKLVIQSCISKELDKALVKQNENTNLEIRPTISVEPSKVTTKDLRENENTEMVTLQSLSEERDNATSKQNESENEAIQLSISEEPIRMVKQNRQVYWIIQPRISAEEENAMKQTENAELIIQPSSTSIKPNEIHQKKSTTFGTMKRKRTTVVISKKKSDTKPSKCLDINNTSVIKSSSEWLIPPSVSVERENITLKQNDSGVWVIQHSITEVPNNTIIKQNEGGKWLVQSVEQNEKIKQNKILKFVAPKKLNTLKKEKSLFNESILKPMEHREQLVNAHKMSYDNVKVSETGKIQFNLIEKPSLNILSETMPEIIDHHVMNSGKITVLPDDGSKKVVMCEDNAKIKDHVQDILDLTLSDPSCDANEPVDRVELSHNNFKVSGIGKMLFKTIEKPSLINLTEAMPETTDHQVNPVKIPPLPDDGSNKVVCDNNAKIKGHLQDILDLTHSDTSCDANEIVDRVELSHSNVKMSETAKMLDKMVERPSFNIVTGKMQTETKGDKAATKRPTTLKKGNLMLKFKESIFKRMKHRAHLVNTHKMSHDNITFYETDKMLFKTIEKPSCNILIGTMIGETDSHVINLDKIPFLPDDGSNKVMCDDNAKFKDHVQDILDLTHLDMSHDANGTVDRAELSHSNVKVSKTDEVLFKKVEKPSFKILTKAMPQTTDHHVNSVAISALPDNGSKQVMCDDEAKIKNHLQNLLILSDTNCDVNETVDRVELSHSNVKVSETAKILINTVKKPSCNILTGTMLGEKDSHVTNPVKIPVLPDDKSNNAMSVDDAKFKDHLQNILDKTLPEKPCNANETVDRVELSQNNVKVSKTAKLFKKVEKLSLKILPLTTLNQGKELFNEILKPMEQREHLINTYKTSHDNVNVSETGKMLLKTIKQPSLNIFTEPMLEIRDQHVISSAKISVLPDDGPNKVICVNDAKIKHHVLNILDETQSEARCDVNKTLDSVELSHDNVKVSETVKMLDETVEKLLIKNLTGTMQGEMLGYEAAITKPTIIKKRKAPLKKIEHRAHLVDALKMSHNNVTFSATDKMLFKTIEKPSYNILMETMPELTDQHVINSAKIPVLPDDGSNKVICFDDAKIKHYIQNIVDETLPETRCEANKTVDRSELSHKNVKVSETADVLLKTLEKPSFNILTEAMQEITEHHGKNSAIIPVLPDDGYNKVMCDDDTKIKYYVQNILDETLPEMRCDANKADDRVKPSHDNFKVSDTAEVLPKMVEKPSFNILREEIPEITDNHNVINSAKNSVLPDDGTNKVMCDDNSRIKHYAQNILDETLSNTSCDSNNSGDNTVALLLQCTEEMENSKDSLELKNKENEKKQNANTENPTHNLDHDPADYSEIFTHKPDKSTVQIEQVKLKDALQIVIQNEEKKWETVMIGHENITVDCTPRINITNKNAIEETQTQQIYFISDTNTIEETQQLISYINNTALEKTKQIYYINTDTTESSLPIARVSNMIYTNPEKPKFRNDSTDINRKPTLKGTKQLLVNRITAEKSSRFRYDETPVKLIELGTDLQIIQPTSQMTMEIKKNVPKKYYPDVMIDHAYCKKNIVDNSKYVINTQYKSQPRKRNRREINAKRLRNVEKVIKNSNEDLIQSSVIEKIIEDLDKDIERTGNVELDTSTLDWRNEQIHASRLDDIEEYLKTEVVSSKANMSNYINVNYNLNKQNSANNNAMAIEIKVEQRDSELPEVNHESRGDYDWSIERFSDKIEQEEVDIKEEPLTEDTDTASETYLDNESYHPIQDKHDKRSQNSEYYQSDPGSDDSESCSYNYRMEPLESRYKHSPHNYENSFESEPNSKPTGHIQSDFDMNNITVSFSNFAFDKHQRIVAVAPICGTTDNINVTLEKNSNSSSENVRNTTPDLLEPLYYTNWKDETYNHELSNETSKSHKRKASDQLKSINASSTQINDDSQLTDPSLSKRKKRRITELRQINYKDMLDGENYKKPRLPRKKKIRTRKVPAEKKNGEIKLNCEKLFLRPVVLLEKLVLPLNESNISHLKDDTEIINALDRTENYEDTSDQLHVKEQSNHVLKTALDQLKINEPAEIKHKNDAAVETEIIYNDACTLRILQDGELETIRETLRRRSKFYRAKYKCHFCLMTLSTFSYLVAHNKHFHGASAGDYVCDICECRFKDEYALKIHTDSHKSCYKCRWCPREYMCLRPMKDHIRKIHPKRYDQVTNKTALYICKTCKKQYRCKNSLWNHLKAVHKTERNNAKMDLTHNNCSFTDNSSGLTDKTSTFTENNSSLSHSVSSLTDSLYNLCLTPNNTCTDCGLIFRTNFAHRRHIITAHGNKAISKREEKI